MKILIVTYGGGHVTAAIPVWRELARRGHRPVLLALTTAAEVAAQSGVTFRRAIEYIDMSDPEIMRWGRKLANRHHQDGKGISIEESIAYLGVSFRDLAHDLGEQRAWERYNRDGLWCFTPVHFLEAVLKEEKPDFVVATTSPRMERAALRAAYRLGIPSLCMVELFGIQEESWISRPDNGDVVSVSRQVTADNLVAAGRPREKIVLTGSPMFDKLADPVLPERGEAWRNLNGLTSDEILIFWAEQPEPAAPKLPEKVRNHIADICRRHGWRFVIRLHPSSMNEADEQIAEDILVSHGKEPIVDVIHACTVGITLTSTVGMELLLSNKPLLVPKISQFSDMADYGERDGALTVSTMEKIESGLLMLLSNSEPARDLAALRKALPFAGDATQRVCDLILSNIPDRLFSSES